MSPMELAVASTLWLTFGAFLFFGVVHAPALFACTAISLCGAEFVSAIAWSVASDGCVARPCGAFAETARTAAALDIPSLTGLMFALAVVYGLRVARSW